MKPHFPQLHFLVLLLLLSVTYSLHVVCTLVSTDHVLLYILAILKSLIFLHVK